MSKLSGFVRTLPSFWATCPIYAQGVELPKGGSACGKSPLGVTHHENWSPEETALHIERHPEEFKAAGVFTGPRSDGLVILDVDLNLSIIKKKFKALRARKFMGLAICCHEDMIRQAVESVKKKDVYKCVNHVN